MEILTIKETPKTPMVRFDAKGIIELKGRSIPENAVDFYKPLFAWLEEYVGNAASKTQVNMQLEYFNTSSSKCILDIFRILKPLQEGLTINWYYDDDDSLETGNDYESIIRVPFTMIKAK